MSCFRCLVLSLLASNVLAAGDGFLIGAGVEADSSDGLAGSLLGGLGLSEKTWISAGIAKSSVDIAPRPNLETLYADFEIDHWFKPLGVRLGAAYWGDSDILDSTDLRGSIYWRGDKASISGDFEYRDFDFVIPATERFVGRTFVFDANATGVTVRLDLSDTIDLSLSGMKYDYSVDFRPSDNRDIVSFLSASRLSLINSLVANRATATIGVDHGLRRWQLGLSTREGAVDGARTKSSTLSFLTPMASKSDIEFSIGFDDSELYGDVMFFSLFVYFYGGT